MTVTVVLCPTPRSASLLLKLIVELLDEELEEVSLTVILILLQLVLPAESDEHTPTDVEPAERAVMLSDEPAKVAMAILGLLLLEI